MIPAVRGGGRGLVIVAGPARPGFDGPHSGGAGGCGSAANRDPPRGRPAGGPPSPPAPPTAAGAADPPLGKPATAPPPSPASDLDLSVPLVVNGRALGELDVQIRGPTVSGDARRLVALLKPLLAAPLQRELERRVAGRATAPLPELAAPDLPLTYDPGGLEIDLDLPADRMAVQTMSLGAIAPPELTTEAKPARIASGLGIGLAQSFEQAGVRQGRQPLQATLAGYTTLGGFPGLTFRYGGLWTEHGGGSPSFDRALTQAQLDLFGPAITLRAGEIEAPVTGFQSFGTMVGVSIARDYLGIRPFEVIRPAGRGAVALDQPASVIVTVNGVESRRLQLPAGNYQLSSLSQSFGSNDVRLVVEDALGRREIAAVDYFNASTLLERGRSEFGLALGAPQGDRRGEYQSNVLGTGYYRRGWSDRLTAGGGFQWGVHGGQLEGEATLGTPLGLVRLSGAGSEVFGRHGWAAGLDWLQLIHRGRDELTLAASTTVRSPRFGSPLDTTARLNDERWRVDARADWRRGDLGVSLGAGLSDTREGESLRGGQVSVYRSFGRYTFTVLAGADELHRGEWSPHVLVGLTMRLGPRDAVRSYYDNRRSTAVAEYDRYSLPRLDDVSGRIGVRHDSGDDRLEGQIDYLGDRAFLSAEFNNDWASSVTGQDLRETRLRAATFIGFADGHWGLGRPAPLGFALFPRDSTLAGSKVLVRDETEEPLARNGWFGPALAPLQRTYGQTDLTVDVDPLPIGYELGEARLHAFPSSASGYVYPVGSAASRIAVGFLEGPTGPLASLSGTLEMVGGKAVAPRPFFTNAAGRFVADGLAPGVYVLKSGDVELARFAIPIKAQGVVDVGRLVASSAPDR